MLHTTVSGTHPTEELPISNKRHQYRIPSINALCLNRSNQTRKPDDTCESQPNSPWMNQTRSRILSPIQKGNGRPIRPLRRGIGPSPTYVLDSNPKSNHLGSIPMVRDWNAKRRVGVGGLGAEGGGNEPARRMRTKGNGRRGIGGGGAGCAGEHSPWLLQLRLCGRRHKLH